MLENARKIVVPLVLMNRPSNQRRHEVYYVWNCMCDTKKGSLLLRTGVSKVKATNTYVLNSKESGYPRPYILEESSSVSDKKGSLLLLE